jgi:hypothetical protein
VSCAEVQDPFEMLGLFAGPGTSLCGLGWNVRSGGAELAGSIWALNSGALSLQTLMLGACYSFVS